MAFHFSLAALLRLRKSVEHQQELLLQQAQQRVNACRQEILATDIATAELDRASAQSLQLGTSAAELQLDSFYRSQLRQRRDLFDQELTQREEFRAARQLALQKARRQREAVENLRRRQLEAYLQDQARREQQRLDEMFLQRRGRRQQKISAKTCPPARQAVPRKRI